MRCYCERCDRLFGSWSALHRHETDSSHHNKCQECSKDFSTFIGLKEHWIQSTRHQYCQRCDEHFDDLSELEDHYTEAHAYCRPCKRSFVNEFGLKEHYRQSRFHHYCPSCNRLFQSESNVNSHLNSSMHRSKDVICQFGGCGMKFVSQSALLLHLEGGACQSGIDRVVVNDYVRQYDTNNLITDPSRLLTDGTSNSNTKYYASAISWNGHGYECYFCHRIYASLAVLNQHLGSPVHQDKIYICPASNCLTRFTTLSALCQHIESGKCGVSKFKHVQQTMDSILGSSNLLLCYALP